MLQVHPPQARDTIVILHGIWLVLALSALYLGYRLGHRAGYKAGNKEGFVNGLKRSIAVQKPTEILCRTLVPRTISEYGRYFASLLH